MKNPWGDIGETAAREIVRENLWYWNDGGNCDPEDLLHMAWFGMQPWIVKLEGKALQGLVKLAPWDNWESKGFLEAVMWVPLCAHFQLFRLRQEGRWDLAVEMVRHPEVYGPVGDVLDLGWTREAELDEWVEASGRSWGAYEGVKRLLTRLRDGGHPIPPVLHQWAVDVAVGDRRQPSLAHRPAAAAYRDSAIVGTIGTLITRSWNHKARIKKLTLDAACQLVGEELKLQPETVLKIWRKGCFFWSPWFVAPAIRPF